MSCAITTHVLDVARGAPAAGMVALLERLGQDGSWRDLARAQTDSEGRIRSWGGSEPRGEPGVYRLTFYTKPYFEARGVTGFFPHVDITFEIREPGHYHVPLLLSPFGYSTYRGS